MALSTHAMHKPYHSSLAVFVALAALWSAASSPVVAQKKLGQSSGTPKKVVPSSGAQKKRATSSLPVVKLELVSSKRIWGEAKHNGFPDLIRFQGTWYCCCREGDEHVGGANGKIRVIASTDGEVWEPVALLAEEGVDLRDPKLSETPDGRLMLVMGGSVFRDGDPQQLITMQSRVAFSGDGKAWTPLEKIIEDKHWLWRVTWHQGRAYGISKVKTGDATRGFLYTSTDGLAWQRITELEPGGNYVSETTLRFTPEGEMVALIRPGYLGVSSAPYEQWSFRQVPAKLSGPNLIRRDDGSWWATTRGNGPLTAAEQATTTKTAASRTILAQVSPDGAFRQELVLPSGGDTGYAGLAFEGDTLWLAYYASHEGQGIYLAKVRFEKP
ncbi:MAG: glycoside hydrolase [Planctomycetia bacterium]|nr:glycoside hydrolase [Planctomycetia bacterium]